MLALSKTDLQVLADVNEMLTKQVKKLGKVKETGKLVVALNVTSQAIADMINTMQAEADKPAEAEVAKVA